MSNWNPLFKTEAEAKAMAEGGVSIRGEGLGLYHVFVYKLNGWYGVLWHFEDKYIFSFLPFGAVVCWHGEKTVDQSKITEWVEDTPYPWQIVWDARASNFNQNDHDIAVNQLGKEKGEALWSLLTKDERE